MKVKLKEEKMISKQLLSEVLSFNENWYVYSLYLEDNILNINAKSSANEKASDFIEINIYELAHKCKEWALSKDYYLRAEQGINYNDNLQWTCFLNINMDDGAEYIDYWNSTEPEAIFKACQWILENK